MTASRYVGPIRRRQYGRGHRYEDANGVKVPGVTTIIGEGIPKPALVNWAGNATAEAAVDRWDELSELTPSKRLSTLQKARYADRDTAANRGTQVHDFAQRFIAGEEAAIPDEIAGHVESYVHFVEEWQPDPVLVEAVVMSHKYGVAGTLDLVADFPGELIARQSGCEWAADLEVVRAILDIKTSRSGIFGEVGLQLAVYRGADVYIDADGKEQPMPATDLALALHVRADDYELFPVEAGPEQVREWLYAREVARFVNETSKSYVGAPFTPPSRLKRRRLEVLPEGKG